MRRSPRLLLALSSALLAAACGTLPEPAPRGGTSATAVAGTKPASASSLYGTDIVLFAMGLLDTDYRYGGKNPAAGLDCSGMVSHIYNAAAGLRLSGSAADIARGGRPIERDALRPGDLVFFNTSNKPYSHVGIYIGDARFIHAPSSNGKVRIDQLTASYYARRYETARTYFD